MQTVPDRTQIIDLTAKHMYSGRILNNAHRGDIVEVMVLSALGPEWKHVGLGWHPWDLQRGAGNNRVRAQVRRTAAIQLWGPTKHRNLQFLWIPHPPSYFNRYNPDEIIESEGWFCEVFIFEIHDETDCSIIDQADPTQWDFMVIPTSDLQNGTNQISLFQARDKWRVVKWDQLHREVERHINGH